MAKGQPKVAKHRAALASDRPVKQPHSKDAQPTHYFSWRFGGIDKDGPFAWTSLDDPAEYKDVMERLHCFEGMDQKQLQMSGSHPIAISSLSREAQRRLEHIQQDDVDELMSFRITGPKRVFCIRERNVMRVLWYDAAHGVCLSKLKGT
ncbi:hypothetical protein LZ023_02535 [Pseudomonas silvicola]|nr:hypothetical protein LZ023_02535 [Pseudomonas silvicola]